MSDLGINKVKLDVNYANPYEKIKATYGDSEFFSKEMWDAAAASGGDALNDYAYVLTKQKDLPSLSDLTSKYSAFKLGDVNTKLQVMHLELNKDLMSKEETRKKRTTKTYDENGNETTVDLGEMTDYEYFGYELNKYGENLTEIDRLNTIEQWKSERGALERLGNDVVGLLGEFALAMPNGIANAVDLLSNILNVAADSVTAVFGGLTWDEVGKRFRDRFTDDIWLNVGDLSTDNPEIFKNYAQAGLDEIEKWEMNYTDLIDAYGNRTDFSGVLSGVVQTGGELLATWGIGKGVKAASTTLGVGIKGTTVAVKVTHGVRFYSNMFQNMASEYFKNDYKNEHATLEILGATGAQVAADFAVQALLGKIGKTALNVLQTGGKITGSIANPVLRVFISGLKDGAEEAIQDFSVWAIGEAFDAVGKYDNFYAQDFTGEDFMWSFIGGAMLGTVASAVEQVNRYVRSNAEFKNLYFNEENLQNAKQEYETRRNVLVERRNNTKSVAEMANNAIYDEKTNKTYENGTPEYKAYYDEKIGKIDEQINTLDNEAREYEIEFNKRLEQRKLNYESLDKKEKRTFKRGFLGLLNAMSELADYEWNAKHTARNAKVATYFANTIKSAYGAVANLFGTIGQTSSYNFMKLLTELESRSLNKDSESLIAASDAKMNTDDFVKVLKLSSNMAFKALFELCSKFKVERPIAENISETIEENGQLIEQAAKTNPETVGKTEMKANLDMMFDGNDFRDSNGDIVDVKVNEQDTEGVSEKALNNAKALKGQGVDVGIITNTNTPLVSSNAILIPAQQMDDNLAEIQKSAGVQSAILGVSANLPANVKEEIVEKYVECYGPKLTSKLTTEDILRMMLISHDNTLLNFTIMRSSKKLLPVFINICKWVGDEVRKENKGPMDEYTKKALSTLKDKLKPAIRNYLTQQLHTDDAIIQSLPSIFTKAEITSIERSRYNFIIRNKLIDNVDSLTKVEKDIVTTRINNMVTLLKTEKDELLKQIFSDVANDRISAISKIDDYYDGIFNGPFNDEKYLKPDGSVGVDAFNAWLIETGNTVVKLRNLAETNFDKVTTLFEQFSARFDNSYKAKFDNTSKSGIRITDDKTVVRFKNSVKENSQQYHEFAVRNGLLTSDILSFVLRDDLNTLELDLLSVDDVINRPKDYIKPEYLKNIKHANRQTVWRLLNDLLKQQDGKYFILPDANGAMRLFAYHNYEQVVNNDLPTDVFDVKPNERIEYPISKFINAKFLTSPSLKSVKVRITKNGSTSYNDVLNIVNIALSDVEKSSNDRMYALKVNIAHEFNHVLDTFNGLNLGMTAVNKVPKEVLDDLSKHVMLKTKGDDYNKLKTEKDAVGYLYLLSGEQASFGSETALFSLPNIVKYNEYGQKVITTPWGSVIKILGDEIVEFNGKRLGEFTTYVELENSYQKLLLQYIDGTMKEVVSEEKYKEYKEKVEGTLPVYPGTNKRHHKTAGFRSTTKIDYVVDAAGFTVEFKTKPANGEQFVTIDIVDRNNNDARDVELFDKAYLGFTINDIFEVPEKFRKEYVETLLAYQKLHNDIDVMAYRKNGIGSDIEDDSFYHKIRLEKLLRKHPEYREIMYKAMWMRFYSFLTYDEFLNMDFPYVRLQSTNQLVHPDKGLAAASMVSDTARMSQHFASQSDEPIYAFFGTIKPKDALGFVITNLAHEVLLDSSTDFGTGKMIYVNDDSVIAISELNFNEIKKINTRDYYDKHRVEIDDIVRDQLIDEALAEYFRTHESDNLEEKRDFIRNYVNERFNERLTFYLNRLEFTPNDDYKRYIDDELRKVQRTENNSIDILENYTQLSDLISAYYLDELNVDYGSFTNTMYLNDKRIDNPIFIVQPMLNKNYTVLLDKSEFNNYPFNNYTIIKPNYYDIIVNGDVRHIDFSDFGYVLSFIKAIKYEGNRSYFNDKYNVLANGKRYSLDNFLKLLKHKSEQNRIEDYIEETHDKQGNVIKRPAGRLQRPGQADIKSYKEAKDYVEKIDAAFAKRKNKSFGTIDKTDYGLPIELLIDMKTGKYTRQGDLKYQTAKAIIKSTEHGDVRKEKHEMRRTRGEIYNYGKLNKTRAKGTIAEYYINNGRYTAYPAVLTEGMREFLYNADIDKLDKKLSTMIREQQPTQDGIFDYIRNNYDTMNDYTFDIIKQSFFWWSPIESVTELVDFVDIAPQLHALYGALLQNDLFEYAEKEILKRIKTAADYQNWINAILAKVPVLNERYNELYESYPTNIDKGQLALSSLRFYSRTIASGANVAEVAAYQVNKSHWTSRTAKKDTVGLETKIGTGRDDKDLSLLDTLVYTDSVSDSKKIAEYTRIRYAEMLKEAKSNAYYEKRIKPIEERIKLYDEKLTKLLQTKKRADTNLEKWKADNETDKLEKYDKLVETIAKLKNEIKELELDIEDVKKEIEIMRNKIDEKTKNFIEDLEDESNDFADRYVLEMYNKYGIDIEDTDAVLDTSNETEMDKLMKSYHKTIDRRQQVAENFRKLIKRNEHLINKNTYQFVPDKLKEYITFNGDKANVDVDKIVTHKITKQKSIRSKGKELTRINHADDISPIHYAFKELFATIKYEVNMNESFKKKHEIEKRKRERAEKELLRLKQNKVVKKEKVDKTTKAKVTKEGNVVFETKLPDAEYVLQSNRPIPGVLYELLSTEFSKVHVSTTQRIKDENKIQQIEIGVGEFIDRNASKLQNLSNTDVEAIVDFYYYASSPAPADGLEAQRIVACREIILSYIMALDSDGVLSLSDNIKNRIEFIINSSVHAYAGGLGRWHGILGRIKPWNRLVKQLRKIYDVEIDSDDAVKLDDLIRDGDTEKIERQLNIIRDKLIKQAKKDKKEHPYRWVAEQFVNYMRAAMLSAPNTMIRNKISNVGIEYLGELTKKTGNLAANLINKLTGRLDELKIKDKNLIPIQKEGLNKGYRASQVNLNAKLDMTFDRDKKVYTGKDAQIGNFVETFVEKSGIMQMIDGGISRYDLLDTSHKGNPDYIEGKVFNQDMTFMLLTKVIHSIKDELAFDVKLLKPFKNLVSKLGIKVSDEKIPDGFIAAIYKAQSDSRWINKAFKKYFAILLKDGNFSNVIEDAYTKQAEHGTSIWRTLLRNEKFVEAVSQAYGYASYEYVHRGNFIGDFMNMLSKKYPNWAIVLQLFAPFVSGGFNWFVEGLKYNPIGLLTSIVRFVRLDSEILKSKKRHEKYKYEQEGPRPKYNWRFTEFTVRNDLGKGLWGTLWFGIAMALAAFGFIVKDPDDDKYKLNAFGGFYLDISSIYSVEPILIGAALTDALKQDGFNVFDVIEQVLMTTFENFFVTNVINSMKYNTGILEVASDKLITTIGSFIPNVWKAIVRMTKTGKMKYTSGVIGDLEYLAYSVVPFLNWNKRVDPYTGDIDVRYSDSWLINMLNETGIFGGMKVKTNIPTDVEEMVRELGLDIGELKGEYDDIGKLNYGVLNAVYGKLNNEALTAFMNDKVAYEVTDAKNENKKVTLKYSKMTTEQKKQVINRIKRNNANYAKIAAWTQAGHKYYTNSSERETLRKLGIRTNVYLKTGKLNGFR